MMVRSTIVSITNSVCMLLYSVHDLLYVSKILKQVDGMDALAVKQACKFAKEHALKNGPIVSAFIRFLCCLF